MNDIQRLAQKSALHYEGDIGFGSTLSTGDHTDTVASQGTEKLTCNTWRMLHVFTHHGNRGKILLQIHLVHRTHVDFLLELVVEHFASLLSILVAHTDRRGVF